MGSGYSVLFDNKCCVIQDKKTNQTTANVHMAQNKMFPLQASNVVNCALAVRRGDNEENLWHLLYGHLNVNGLRLLSKKKMVIWLQKITAIDFCEGCVLGKHSRNSFPSGNSWRAYDVLDLVHADLCGLMKTESLGGSKYFLLLTDDYSRWFGSIF